MNPPPPDTPPPSAPTGGPQWWRRAKGLQHTPKIAQQKNLMDLCDCIEIYSLSSEPVRFFNPFFQVFSYTSHQMDESRGGRETGIECE